MYLSDPPDAHYSPGYIYLSFLTTQPPTSYHVTSVENYAIKGTTWQLFCCCPEVWVGTYFGTLKSTLSQIVSKLLHNGDQGSPSLLLQCRTLPSSSSCHITKLLLPTTHNPPIHGNHSRDCSSMCTVMQVERTYMHACMRISQDIHNLL